MHGHQGVRVVREVLEQKEPDYTPYVISFETQQVRQRFAPLVPTQLTGQPEVLIWYPSAESSCSKLSTQQSFWLMAYKPGKIRAYRSLMVDPEKEVRSEPL